jgi:uncharacterized protein (DUF58 family)
MLALPAIASAQATQSCEAVNFGPQVLAAFPKIADACQGLLTKNGEPFARFTAEVQAANADTVTVNFLDRNNKPVSRVVFAVNNPDARISVSGTQTRITRLQRGTRVTFFIHHNRWGLFADPDSAPLTILSREDI